MTRSSRWSTSICNLNALETESKTHTTAKTSLLDLKRENMQEADKVGEERRIKPLVMSKSKDTLVAMNRISPYRATEMENKWMRKGWDRKYVFPTPLTFAAFRTKSKMVGFTPLTTLAGNAWLALALPGLNVTVAISGAQRMAVTSRRGRASQHQ